MEKEYIWFRESLIQSVLADSYTFGLYILMLTLNAKLWHSGFLNVAISIFLVIFATAKANSKMKKFTDKQQLKDYVNSL